jgi:adenylosuccinate synthase
MIVDTVEYMNKAIKSTQKSIIAEGANAALLDIDFGTYPYVTSSSTTVGGVMTGLGVPPKAIKTTIGIMKAYTTRVGGGPFPTELTDDLGKQLQTVGHEFGSTTGRPRRCGWLDLNVVRYGHKLNGYDSLNITKLDVLSGIPKLKVAI